ncbi:MAG: hypothetical protein II085_00495, partial [Alphaproteobacteria bacterium]|nr:hypothetical protein [Alphaproteobacteria bacterium]
MKKRLAGNGKNKKALSLRNLSVAAIASLAFMGANWSQSAAANTQAQISPVERENFVSESSELTNLREGTLTESIPLPTGEGRKLVRGTSANFSGEELNNLSEKIANLNMGKTGTATGAAADITPTLDRVKSDITSYMSETHDTYTATTEEADGALKLNFFDNTTNTNVTYYITPSDTDRDALSAIISTGSAFLRVAESSETPTFIINGVNYVYDPALVLESCYTLTETTETSGDNIYLIPEYDPETQTTTDKYYKLEYKDSFYTDVTTPTLGDNSAYTLTETTQTSGGNIYQIGDKYYQLAIRDGVVSHGRISTNQGGTNITGHFINLSTITSSGKGGAIYNYTYNGTATIGNITGDFIGNIATTSDDQAYGGAIYNYAGHNNGTASIGNITGDFIGNRAVDYYGCAYGGAIHNENGTIDNITGNFIGNSTTSWAAAIGGAIYNGFGYYVTTTIANITGNFIGNSATATDAYAYGGAIYNSATIGNITGDFIGN